MSHILKSPYLSSEIKSLYQKSSKLGNQVLISKARISKLGYQVPITRNSSPDLRNPYLRMEIKFRSQKSVSKLANEVTITKVRMTRFEVVVSFYWHHVTKIHNLAANAPNDLLFVPYEAYYNVVLGNHNLKGLAYLTSVKNGFKIGKRVKKGPKKALFQTKVPD